MEDNKKKRWSDMSIGQKVLAIFGVTAQLALLGAALWDIWHRPADQIRGGRKLWTGLSFVNFIGPIAYFVFGAKRQGAAELPVTELKAA